MSYSYLILFEFPPKGSSLPDEHKSYLIPNSEISYEERQTLREMQMRGQLDFEDHARPDPKKYAGVNTIVLYLFEKSKDTKWEDGEKRFVEIRIRKEFDPEDVGKWNKYERKDKSRVEHNVSAIYELVNNTFSYSSK